MSGPVSALTDRRVRLQDLWGRRAEGLGADVMAQDDDRQGIAIIESFLRGFHVAPSDGMVLARDLSERIAADRALTRVEQLSSLQQTHVRALQRLFNEHVGVGPKWVIQRFRLLDAAQRVSEGAVVDWSGLALDLGYSDQAHFIRDFKRLVGRSPADYAKRLQGGGPWDLDR
jgi:AraC-like DNA-binding protein